MARIDEAGRPVWPRKHFDDDVPPHKRNLAEALQELCQHLLSAQAAKQDEKPLTQAQAAQRLHCSESALSKALSGRSVPSVPVIDALHREACRNALGERTVGITPDDLSLLRKLAVEERQLLRRRQAAGSDVLLDQLRAAESKCAILQQEIEELAPLRDEIAGLRAALKDLGDTRAGLQRRVTPPRGPTSPPPVPHRRGDRRRMRRDVSAVRALATQAGELDAEGRAGVALRLLQRSSKEVLSPVETAGLLLLLRQQQQDELADNLIHVYGRDQGDRDVLHVALTLHEQGSPGDAGAILQAALE
ncbi:helix-turn-helix domain-containing protein [Streptomyces sp. NPDC058737]|uniref:helix-turn-helix domain-containing protein n=1 Tax=Streptomyces sp. NPDC058737 TaxID=3346617 RepID=UPI0036BFA4B7